MFKIYFETIGITVVIVIMNSTSSCVNFLVGLQPSSVNLEQRRANSALVRLGFPFSSSFHQNALTLELPSSPVASVPGWAHAASGKLC